LPHSRDNAIKPKAARERNIVPVTSSHKRCNTWPQERAVARAAEPTACNVRLRDACCATTCDATLATAPNFRAVESWLTLSILAVSGATMTQRITGLP
jgi:hypothetical protein